MSLDPWLEKNLMVRKEKNSFRDLKPSTGLTDFCSNDYLGLARSPDLFSRINERSRTVGVKQNGATGSRLLSGNSELIESVEHKLAIIFNSQRALIFNSGYTANIAIFSSIPQKHDTILLDELAHASIKDGARLSLAHRYNFRHNDLNDLESKLKRINGKVFIAVESIYSMDGDECPLEELTALAARYRAFVILDEAHSTGVRGNNGSGLATSLGLEEKIDIRLYTFGKAMGVHGACVAGSNTLIEYLVNFARPFIYTTAPAPHSIVAIASSFDYLIENQDLQQELQKRIDAFVKAVDLSNRTLSNSAIQTIIVPGNENVKKAALHLQQSGFDVRAVLSPTVPAGKERLRICLHTYNTLDEIGKLTSELKKL
ncbi:MAG TPA: 8-amino-7-oxononanoate synthase [Chryseolinea sp.]